MRRPRLAPLSAAAAVAVAIALGSTGSAAAAADTTGPLGPFGFTTVGLDKNANNVYGSYGEPSLAIAPDGQHVAASTPGCGGVCYWTSADNGTTWARTKTAGGGGDSELDFLPDGTLISADLDIQD